MSDSRGSLAGNPPRFTVLLPVLRPPALLPIAIESALAQSVQAFELFVVCDGAPPETVSCAEAFAARDRRIRVFRFPKGKRHGEAHRHTALQEAAGTRVAHITDDDIWLPNHLAELDELLATVDFGNTLHVHVTTDGRVGALPRDIGDPAIRERMLREKFNAFGPTFAGYRLDAYRRLPEGWAPAPPGMWTDLNMWRKFLRCDGLTFASRVAVTALHFPAPARADMTLEQRAAENRSWWTRMQDPGQRNTITQNTLRGLGYR
jgi:glycosyltransferase involved in cell wall biosynthesis